MRRHARCRPLGARIGLAFRRLSCAIAVALVTGACSGDAFTEKRDTGSDDSRAGRGGSDSSTGGSEVSPGGGGTVSSSGGSPATTGGSGPSTGGSGSGGSPPDDYRCPLNAPVENSACQVPGLRCSYGNDPRPSCRPYFECQGDMWVSLHQGVCSRESTCPSAPPEGGTECVSVNLICAYPDDGVFCGCPLPEGINPRTWVCSQPGTGQCPLVLPNDGTPCDDDGVHCNYGHCRLDDAVVVDCAAGRWTWSEVAC